MARSSSGKLDRPPAVRACRPTPTMNRESLEALITSRSAQARIELGAREVTLANLDSIEEIRHCVESKKSAA